MSEVHGPNILNLINRAEEEGIHLFVEDGKIQYRIKEGHRITDNILDELRESKQEIFEFLTELWENPNKDVRNRVVPIDREIIDEIPLSLPQERIWFIHKLEGSLQYQNDLRLELKGELDEKSLSWAIREVVNRHESIRTVFRDKEGAPYQKILPKNLWELKSIDIRRLPTKTSIEDYTNMLVEEPFDLENDHMLKGFLIKASNDRHILVLVMHHIVFDQWSYNLLIEEILECYKARVKGEPHNLNHLPIQYADFAFWQSSPIQKERITKKSELWIQKLKDLRPLELPTDYVRQTKTSSRGGVVEQEIGIDLVEKIVKVNKKEGVTMFTTLLAIFKILLSRYSQQTDIVVGTPVSGRSQEETEFLIGFFSNLMVIRSSIDLSLTFSEFLMHVKSNTLDAQKHQDVPYDKLVDLLTNERDLSRNALFQAQFSYNNHSKSTIDSQPLSGLKISEIPGVSKTSPFELTFDIQDNGKSINLLCEYSSDLYLEGTIKIMMQSYCRLLRVAAENPETALNDLIESHSDSEVDLLNSFNKTNVNIGSKTVVELFESKAKIYPDELAIKFQTYSLSYRELDQRSNRLANYIINHDVKRGSLVGLCVGRSHMSVIGLLAILKAGCVYLPIDIQYPHNRIEYIIKDSSLSTVILDNTSSHLSLLFKEQFIIDLDTDETLLAKESINDIYPKPSIDDLAYVIYTSGTTGTPKGVMIEHEAINNTISSQIEIFGVRKSDVCLQFAATSFDASISEILICLLSGSTLLIASEQDKLRPEAISNLILSEQVTVSTVPPSYLKLITKQALSSLRILITAGEVVHPTHIPQIARDSVYFNAYGPTEGSICASVFKATSSSFADNKSVPIGTPIANTKIRILSKDNTNLAISSIGEVGISGVGLARGYMNDPELTSQKFVRSPVINETIYKSGDFGRITFDGNLEFIGRQDDQVKVNAHRIELAEIENVLNGSELVKQGVVCAKEDRLIGFVIVDQSYSYEKIQSYLLSRLPKYMVPSEIQEIDEFPLTINGKVDKKTLTNTDGKDSMGAEYLSPNNIEQKLVGICSNILSIDIAKINIRDNFFRLGGNSMLAIQFVSQIHKEFQCEVDLVEIFETSDLKELAELISPPENEGNDNELSPIQVQDYYDVTYLQRRIWYQDQLGEYKAYLISHLLRINQYLDVKCLNEAYNILINRHEILRTTFHLVKDSLKQRVHKPEDFFFSVDLIEIDEKEKSKIDQFIQETTESKFDMCEGPLFRNMILKFSETQYLSIFTIHHIISDERSSKLFEKELLACYSTLTQGSKPKQKPLEIQFKDYAAWENRKLDDNRRKECRNYWLAEFSKKYVPLNISGANQRPEHKTIDADCVFISLGASASASLKSFVKSSNYTTYMVILSSIYILLSFYSGQNDICIGSPVSKRNLRPLQDMLGCLLDTLIIRMSISNRIKISQFLDDVQRKVLKAHKYIGYPYEELLTDLKLDFERSRNPLFDVGFNFIDSSDAVVSNFDLESIETERYSIKSDIWITAIDEKDSLEFCFEFNSKLFSKTLLQQIAANTVSILKYIVSNPDSKISEIEHFLKERNKALELQKRRLIDSGKFSSLKKNKN